MNFDDMMGVVGYISESKNDRCEVQVSSSEIPKVGEWVHINGSKGVVETFRYKSDSQLYAFVRMIKDEDAWIKPFAPGTPVTLVPKGLTSPISPIGIFGGCYRSGSSIFPISLEPRYLLGPEGAHFNVSGVSGLATKTSYLMTVLWDLMHKVRKKSESVASIVINLKYQDLMYLDRPAINQPTSSSLLKDLSLTSDPFEGVRYFASAGSSALERSDVAPFGYSIDTGLGRIKNLVWNLDDPNRTLEALVDTLAKARVHMPEEFGPYLSWRSLITEAPLVEDGIHPNSWSHFPIGTIRKLVRHLTLVLENQNTGLFLDTTASTMDTVSSIIRQIRPGGTYVLDFSSMTTTEQFFCMSELVQTLYAELTSATRRLPDHLVVFVDELNRYGAAGAKSHPIRDLLIEISERGRSLGLSLFSAQQRASDVHNRIINNAATRAVGRTSADEAAHPIYRYLSSEQSHWVRYLPKGELLVNHAPIGQAIKIQFPQPIFRIG